MADNGMADKKWVPVKANANVQDLLLDALRIPEADLPSPPRMEENISALCSRSGMSKKRADAFAKKIAARGGMGTSDGRLWKGMWRAMPESWNCDIARVWIGMGADPNSGKRGVKPSSAGGGAPF